MLNSSTVESDEEKDNLNYYPSDADEDKEVTCSTLLDKVKQMQRELPSFDQATRRRLSEVCENQQKFKKYFFIFSCRARFRIQTPSPPFTTVASSNRCLT